MKDIRVIIANRITKWFENREARVTKIQDEYLAKGLSEEENTELFKESIKHLQFNLPDDEWDHIIIYSNEVAGQKTNQSNKELFDWYRYCAMVAAWLDIKLGIVTKD